MPPLDMTDILREIRKHPPRREPEPTFGPGPLPATFIVPAEELDALLRDSERLDRLAEFLSVGSVETSLATIHDGDLPNQPEAQSLGDDADRWSTRRWVIGYSIETEHRGCYRFETLATGRDFRATVDAGLAAWVAETARWVEQSGDVGY